MNDFARTTTGRELLDTEPAAQHLGLSAHTLEIWRATRRYDLPYIRVGRRIKYRRSDLDAWLESRTVSAETA